MEKKEFDLDLVAPKGRFNADNCDLYFQVLTERLNILWAEYFKKREKDEHEKPYT